MEIKEINELTRNWTVDEFADFLHYLLQHGDRESIRSWWCSTSLLRKLEAAGLAELDGGEVALTPSGSKLRDALYLLEESDGLADARLNLRIHRLEDPHAAPLGADALRHTGTPRTIRPSRKPPMPDANRYRHSRIPN